MLVILGKLEVHPDNAARAAALAKTMVEATLQESGCLHYAFGRDLERPHRLWLSERWESEAALAAHFATPHMAAFRQGLGGLRLQHLSATRYDVAGAVDLIGR